MFDMHLDMHLSDRQLLLYQEQELAPKPRARVEAHLRDCSACQQRLARMTRTTAHLETMLHDVGQQVPLNPERSWQAVSSRRAEQRQGSALWAAFPLRPLLRYTATLGVLALLIGGLVGLIHTLAVTGPPPDDVSLTPTPTSVTSPSPPPGPLPRPQIDARATAHTILLLGVDGERVDSDHVDALMLFHLDAEGQRAFLLSIPRNLHVQVPGRPAAPAGAVYRMGQPGEADDGLALARRAISDTVGLPVDDVALIRFESFITLIDAIGGVNVRVPHPIDDPDFPDGEGGSVPFAVPVGPRHFDGATALRYARTRVVPAPGFDRPFRQRQLAQAVHERITRLDLLPDLIAQSSTLWAAAKSGIETTLSLSDGIDLALVVAELGSDDLITADLGVCCTTWHTTPTGERELWLDPQAVEELLRDPSNQALNADREFKGEE